MSRLPRDVTALARWLLREEAAEVILGDLEEDAWARFGEGPSLRRAFWLRAELARSVVAVRLSRRGPPGDDRTGPGLRETGPGGTGGAVRALLQDLRHALRGLARSPAFTLFAAGTLALGVGSATAVYSAVERVILNPLPYPDAERMVVLWRTTDGEVVFIPEMKHLRRWQELEVFERIEAYRAGNVTLTGRGEPTTLRTKAVTPGYFDILGVAPHLGRGFSPDEQVGEGDRVLLLSHDFWRARFGGRADVLGETLTLDDEPWTVVGVLPPGVYPPNSGPGLTQLWTPLGDPAEAPVWPLAMLRPGASVDEANARLQALAAGAPEAGLGAAAEWRARAFDAAEFGRGRVAGTLRILFAAVALLLLVAAVNVSNLLYQRAVDRSREMAVRAVLGAGRGRLLREILMESLVLALMGGAVGVVLARIGVTLVETYRPESVAWLLDGLPLDARILALSLVVTVTTGLGASVLPALGLRRGDRTNALLRGRAGDGVGSGRSVAARWALVGGEVALCFALLTATVTLVHSLAELRSRDLGLRTAGLVAVDVGLPDWRYDAQDERAAAFETVAAELRRTPGVQAVGIFDALPPGLPGTLARLHPRGREPSGETTYVRDVQGPTGLLELLGQPLLAGRDLRTGDADGGAHNVVVGRALASRLFPEGSIPELVGRGFALDEDGETLTIVGVAEDIRTNGPASEAGTPHLYRPREHWYRSQVLAVRLTEGVDEDAWLRGADVRERVLARVPDAVVDVETARGAMSDSLAQERFTTLLLSSFAALAMLVAAVGMYGVLSRTVAGRSREIGIRMSLGADAGAVRWLVLRGGAAAVAAGLGVGAGLAWLGLRTLSSGLFGVGTGGAGHYLTAAGLLGVVAAAAIWLPVRRATRLDPSIAMRCE